MFFDYQKLDSVQRGKRRKKKQEAFSNNRSVMPLDILGCTRATMKIVESNNIWQFRSFTLFTMEIIESVINRNRQVEENLKHRTWLG